MYGSNIRRIVGPQSLKVAKTAERLCPYIGIASPPTISVDEAQDGVVTSSGEMMVTVELEICGQDNIWVEEPRRRLLCGLLDLEGSEAC